MEIAKDDDHLIVVFKVSGKKELLVEMSETLATRPEIISFS
nr:hypothetical protein [uncultured Sphingobacterium sp.]